jgi:hypothetical protein
MTTHSYNKIIYVIALVILVIFAAFIMSGRFTRSSDEEELTGVCTLDAIICPDGTAVGRSGPMCEFDACTSPGPYSGQLTGGEGEFFLSIPSAPESDPDQVVAYFLPLHFSRISNALADLVNNNVIVRGYFSRGNLFEVETIELE